MEAVCSDKSGSVDREGVSKIGGESGEDVGLESIGGWETEDGNLCAIGI